MRSVRYAFNEIACSLFEELKMQENSQILVETTFNSGWRITIPAGRYFLYCTLATLIARAVLSIFKALAIGVSEHLDQEQDGGDAQQSFRYRYWIAIAGFAGHKNIRDYWLPAIIGFCEAVSYPLLIFLNQGVIIGGWIAIKTAGQWKTWQTSRTAFNRFLVGNLLIVALSFFWLLRYISK
jgi:hypothetical protein